MDRISRRTFVPSSALFFCLPLLFGACLCAQKSAPAATPAPAASVPALFLSDIHFDPFLDPAKVPQLAAAPVSQWKAILGSAPSPDQAARLEALGQQCRIKGLDTSDALLQSSLRAMRAEGAGVKFITVSGDLMAHAFDCKFNALFPQAAPGDYRAFTLKTLEYIQSQLTAAFPGVPLLVAMGNNDSDCGDYQLDTHSDFLAAEGKLLSAGFPASERKAAEESFAAAGYYSVSLPSPLQHTRLLVLDDIYMARKFSNCSGKPDSTGVDEQLNWLEKQLAQARAAKEKVWVMGHIPPGVNLVATGTKILGLCGGRNPSLFLSTDRLAQVLSASGDVISLALFAHTHMDELRLLPPQTAGQPGVALKMVASISPIHGNNPSFTLAQIDPATAELKDYRVIVADSATALPTRWQQEYSFSGGYKAGGFNAATLGRLLAGFSADPSAAAESSKEYLRTVFPGGDMQVLQVFWPQYVCALGHLTAESYTACVCREKP
jgi:sphingomyelin phosphodiesterase acid-like 3